MTENYQNSNNSYGKKPLWQWVVIYAIVGGAVYGLVYYFMSVKNGGSMYTQPANYSSQSSSSSVSAVTQSSSASSQGSVYMTKTDSAKGTYMTDVRGMALYIFDKDKPGISNCYDKCAIAWPPYVNGATAGPTLPLNVTLVKRTDGTMQYAWKGMPLYYYRL